LKRLEQALRDIQERLAGKTEVEKDEAILPDLQPGYWEVLKSGLKL